MEDETQAEVTAFLSRPESYPDAGGDRVDRIDTHISSVFLVGDRAYKLKKAVRLPVLDFTTLERRHAACQAEVAVNRRTAPDLYLGVIPVTREPGAVLAIDGAGDAVDWLVVMRRFDQDALLDRMAEVGALTTEIALALADEVAAFHTHAEPRADYGGRRAMAWIVENNTDVMRETGRDLFDAEMLQRLDTASRAALDRTGDILDERRDAGFVRHCHGDLHLRNICLIDGQPVLFDAIEFSDEIACIDVLYDLAFLIMDLEHRDLGGPANLVFNRYLWRTTDLSGLATLPLFLSCRAAVRAQVSAIAAKSQEEAAASRLRGEAVAYLDIAGRFLGQQPPVLIAIGGLSGSGKTTLGAELAPAIGPRPGAVHLRSDIARKQLHGVDPLTRLPPESYTPSVTESVYAQLNRDAESVLGGGHAVLVDAVFATESERRAVEDIARRLDVPFVGLWLDVPTDVRAQRVEARRDDASDATASVARQQSAYDLGSISWARLDAGGELATTLERARALLPALTGRG